MQLMPGDVVLMKLDAFQGKRKAKDRWSGAEYVVIHQVTNDIPVYEMRDDSGNVKVAHHNRLFLVALTREDTTPLGGSESISNEGTTWSTLAELTPLEWNSEMPESDVDDALTWHLTSCIPLGWIDGVLWPLPSVALRLTLGGLRSGEGTSSLSDEDAPCNKPCITCPKTDHSNIVMSNTDISYKIPGKFNCQSKNVIYVLTCGIHNVQYVGETQQTLNARFRLHESIINTMKENPVADHFNEENHLNNKLNYKINIVGQEANKNRRL